MRFIDKTNRCADFENYAKPASWNDFDANVKLLLHQHLLSEQKHLCLYCQQSVPPKTRKDDHVARPPILHPSHIEHVRPKGVAAFAHLIFEHLNLGVSCNGFDVELPPNHPEFCGHPKNNAFDDLKFLHPFEETDIESFFEFDINGGIKTSGKDDEKANYTIGLLGLNSSTLQNMRAEQYLLILEETASNNLIISDLLDETQAELPKFYSMLKQFFG